MDSRAQALEELKKHIREQRARLDPQLLARAQKALMEANTAPAGANTDIAATAATGKAASEDIPYDRDAAAEIVNLFLDGHKDRKGFEKRLRAFIQRGSH